MLTGCACSTAFAADPPDTLTLTDGEKLSGKFVRATGGSVAFHSDVAGDINVPWTKIQEMTVSGRFAVITKGFQFKRHQKDSGQVPIGTLALADKNLQITPMPGAPAQTVAVDMAGYVVPESEFNAAQKELGFFEDWKGGITGGASVIEATQQSETFTGAVHLTRATPTQNWLAARDKTIVNFTTSYGKIEQPNTPQVKTDLLQFDAERDEYFSARGYLLGQAAFDHNSSQGLSLQQTYSGGAGWSVIKSDIQTLDLKATVSYIRQDFTQQESNKSLVGSIFNETYHRKLAAGIVFDEQITFIPAWNDTSAYSANGSAGITMAISKRFSFNLSTTDAFLNDPPPAFKKNSFTATAGITYTLP
jgi:putative salt-induced outer membrane protein YdiY